MDLGPFLQARLDEEARAYTAMRRAERGLTEHLAHWTPGRLLCELHAKRAIVDRCSDVNYAADRGDEQSLATSAGLTLEILCLLATPYQGHPDYQDAWRPEDVGSRGLQEDDGIS